MNKVGYIQSSIGFRIKFFHLFMKKNKKEGVKWILSPLKENGGLM